MSQSNPEPEKPAEKSSAEAVRQALRRVLWSIQKLAHASLPEITEEPVEVFGKRLEDWDRLCKNALEAEGFLADKKEEKTLEWLERSAREFERLAHPAVAPELAELASSVETAAKLWSKLAAAAARDAGEAAWLERAWGSALAALSARVAALPPDDRRRILEDRLSELRSLKESGSKLLAAGASAGIRPLRRRRLAALLSSRTRRLREEFRRMEDQAAARAAEAGRNAQAEIDDLRRALALSEERAAAAERGAACAEEEGRALRVKIANLREEGENLGRSAAEKDELLKDASLRAEELQDDVQGLQELLKQSDEQSGAMTTRALAAEESKKALARELDSLRDRFAVVERNAKAAREQTAAAEGRAAALQAQASNSETSSRTRENELADLRERLAAAEKSAAPAALPPDESGPKLKQVEAELAAARAECAELRRSLEIAETELRRLSPLAGESSRLKTELDRGQARLAKLTAEFEALAGSRLQ